MENEFPGRAGQQGEEGKLSGTEIQTCLSGKARGGGGRALVQMVQTGGGPDLDPRPPRPWGPLPGPGEPTRVTLRASSATVTSVSHVEWVILTFFARVGRVTITRSVDIRPQRPHRRIRIRFSWSGSLPKGVGGVARGARGTLTA